MNIFNCLLLALLGTFFAGTAYAAESKTNAAFTAIDPRRSIEVAKTIMDFTKKMETGEIAGDASEETFLAALETELSKHCTEGQKINPNAFDLNKKEKAAIKSVDGESMMLALSTDTDYKELESDDKLQSDLKELITSYNEMKRKYSGDAKALLELGELDEVAFGWAVWTKIGVWTVGAILAVPTAGASLAVAGGINVAVSGVDIAVKVGTGDHKGAAVGAIGMTLGAIIPGAGAALDSSYDVVSEVGLDLAADNIDVGADIVSGTIDLVDGELRGAALSAAANTVLVEQSSSTVDVGEILSLKDYRKATDIREKIWARRIKNNCYFDYLVRSSGVDKATVVRNGPAQGRPLPKNFHQLRKMHQEEKALVKIWHNYKRAFGGDLEKLTAEFDTKLAKCRDGINSLGALLVKQKAGLKHVEKFLRR